MSRGHASLSLATAKAIADALERTRQAAREAGLWVIVGTLRPTRQRYLNLAHVIAPSGDIAYEYAKAHLAGRDEQQYCRAGNKVALFNLDESLTRE